jgi:hypothetical protein
LPVIGAPGMRALTMAASCQQLPHRFKLANDRTPQS